MSLGGKSGGTFRLKMKNLCFVFLFLHTDGVLYPYGPSVDQNNPKDDDGVSPAIPATVPLFGKTYSSIYVNNNGLLSFNVSLGFISPEDFPIATAGPFLAPFWADVNNEISGEIYYRLSKDAELLNMAKKHISRYFVKESFSPHWVFVATWDKVPFYGSKTNKVNTFQAVLCSDENVTFTMFNYGDIQWTTGEQQGGDAQGLGGQPALAGGNSGFVESYFKIPGSLTAAIINITDTSNANVPGLWAFKVDQLEAASPNMTIDATTAPTPTPEKTYLTSQKATDLPLTNPKTFDTKVTSPSLGSSSGTTATTGQNSTIITTRAHDATTTPTPTPEKTYLTSQKATDLPLTNPKTFDTKVTSPSLGSSSGTTTTTGQNTTVNTTRAHDATTTPTPTPEKTYLTSQKATDLPSTNLNTFDTKVTNPSLGSSSGTTENLGQNTIINTSDKNDQPKFYPVLVYSPISGFALLALVIILTVGVKWQALTKPALTLSRNV